MKTTILAVISAAVLSSSAVAQPMQGSAPGVTRTDLQRHDLSAPGFETVQARIDIAPGVTAPWHTHPGEEIIYVLEGSLEYQFEGQPAKLFKPGEVLFVPAGVPHKATNVGAGNGAELATYVVRKDKPLITLVK
jgi:quercetin dioxygenase-like cupin family protein